MDGATAMTWTTRWGKEDKKERDPDLQNKGLMRMEDSCNFFISSDINRLFTSKLAASEASIWHVVRKIGGLQPTSDFYYVNIEIELPNKILGYLPEPSIRSLTCPTEIDEYTKDMCRLCASYWKTFPIGQEYCTTGWWINLHPSQKQCQAMHIEDKKGPFLGY